ncbi:MAG: hypothetical protein EA421_01465 [Gemmatimonadales bacterium]|nr:MAG: hypothetical protein EA421_01465 [Gemmatimonadales bacterium]
MNLAGLTLTLSPEAGPHPSLELGPQPSPEVGLHASSDWSSRMEGALETERGLLERLEGILAVQRRAVEEDDLAVLEEETHAARRVLRTLSEARRRRAALLELGVGDPEAALEALEELGVTPGPRLIQARRKLRETAQRLALALAFNRTLISRAERSADRQVRTLLGGAPVTGGRPYAGSGEDRVSPGNGTYLNRQV